MHAAFIFTALIGLAAQAKITNVSEGREFGVKTGYLFQVVDDAQIKQVVEGAVLAIDRISRSPWKAEQKLTAIQQTVEKVSIYRARTWSRSPNTEHKMDLLVGPYESFPHAGNYNKRNCKDYYSTLKIDWEPSAIDTPTIKGVKRAWDNLKAICEG